VNYGALDPRGPDPQSEDFTIWNLTCQNIPFEAAAINGNMVMSRNANALHPTGDWAGVRVQGAFALLGLGLGGP
jgi:hypothetical protein